MSVSLLSVSLYAGVSIAWSESGIFNLYPNHPSQDDLMYFLDGELSSKKSAKLKEHLDHCWQCRTRAAELQETIREFVSFVNDKCDDHVPQPPMRWRRFASELEKKARHTRRQHSLAFNYVRPGMLRSLVTSSLIAVGYSLHSWSYILRGAYRRT